MGQLNSDNAVLDEFGALVTYAAHTFENNADITLAFDDLRQEGYCSLFKAYRKYQNKDDAELRKLLKTAVFRGMLSLYQHIFSPKRKPSIGMLQFVEQPIDIDNLVGVYVEQPVYQVQPNFGFAVVDVLLASTDRAAAYIRELISPSFALRQLALDKYERRQLQMCCGFRKNTLRVVPWPSNAMIADVLGIGIGEIRKLSQTVRQTIESQRLICDMV